MHQDYTAITLLLFTALPLLCVAAAAFFYVKNNERKTPLKREDFFRYIYDIRVLGLAMIDPLSKPRRLSC